VQYRLSEKDGGTLIRFQHLGFGAMPEEHKAGVRTGWAYILESARKRAEGSTNKTAAGQTAR
jgi:hypothetical protein